MFTNSRLLFGIFALVVAMFVLAPAGRSFGAGVPPVANSSSATTLQNTPVTVGFAVSDLDSFNLTVSIVTGPAHGTLSPINPMNCTPLGKGGGGLCTTSATYTPAAGYTGTDSFTYKANDGASDSNIANIVITINAPGNALPPITKSIVPPPAAPVAPTAASVSTTTAQNTAKVVTLTGSDADSPSLTFAIVTGPAHGTLSPLAAPVCTASGIGSNCTTTVTYTPTPGYSGPDTFTYKVNDGALDSVPATVTITVSAGPVNAAPVSNSLNVATMMDAPRAVMLTASDADSAALSFAIVFPPAHGSLGPVSAPVCVPAGSGSNCTAAVTYTPTAGYVGGDSFSFKTNDGTQDSNVATVNITVSAVVPPNQAPTASSQTVTTNFNTAKPISLAGADSDSPALSFTVVTGPAHGGLGAIGAPACVPAGGGTSCTASLTYTPTSGYSGPDSFTFRTSDGALNSNVATVSITVNAAPPNLPPTATPQTVTTAFNTAKPLTLAASDTDSASLTFSIVTAPAHGTLTPLGAPTCLPAGTGSSCTVATTYTPTTGYTGADSFTFKANDGTSDSNVATVSITVSAGPVNAAPTATPQTVTTAFNTAKPLTLAASDTDSASLTFSIVAAPAHGTLTPLGAPTCLPAGTGSSCTVATTYTPTTGYTGADRFTFKANDGTSDSNIATVSITVGSAPPATHFSVTAPATAVAGTGFNLTVTALDASNVAVPSYTGTAHFTSTDGAAVLPADYTFTGADAGVHVFSVTLKTAGSQTITATDTVTPSITGTSGNIIVSAGAATNFIVTAPSTATAGTPFNFSVTAKDASNNTVTGYAGTVHFTSTDGAAALPANTTLTLGSGSFSATLNTAGNQTITATDTVTASITGTSAVINVGGIPATHLSVTAPGTATAGVAFNVTVTALTAANATATSYAGTVHFTSTDGAAVFPADYTFTGVDAGVHVFSVTLKTSGNQSITATDTVTPSITGTSGGITVSAGAATLFTVTAPATAASGAAFNFTVTAKDAFNNTATAYAGTVHFTSTDGSATLPPNTTLTLGTGTFSATLVSLGNQTITATDSVAPSITGASGTIAVGAGAATHYSVVPAGGTAVAGTAFNVTVTARDASNNVVTGYTGTSHFTSTDGLAVLPSDYTFSGADNGVHVFSVTLKTVGNQTITATDTVTGSINGNTGTIVVSAGAATHFTVNAPGAAASGTPFNFIVTALDAANNTATTYAGTVHFISTDGSATLPVDYSFNGGDAGAHTFSATLVSAGTQTITATDTVTASITGTSGPITVTVPAPGAVTDNYTVTGNININVTPASNGVLTNDTKPAGTVINGYSVLSGAGTGTAPGTPLTTTAGGTVNLALDGTFTYDPPAGYIGADGFKYNLHDSGGDSVGTVNLTISNMIWFIDGSATSCTSLASNCGRLSSPFTTIDAFSAVNNAGTNHPATGQTIFVSNGAYVDTTALTLLDGQNVIGKAATVAIDTFAGVTLATYSATLPATSGTAPGVTTTGANVDALILANTNKVRGIDFGNTTGTAIRGVTFGTLTLSEVNVVDTTGTALFLTSGTANATFGTLTGTGNAATVNALQLSSVGGSITATGGALSSGTGDVVSVSSGNNDLTYPGTISNTGSGYAVTFSNHTGGTSTFTGQISDAGGSGKGVKLNSGSSGIYVFSGGMNLATGANDAFAAASVGTVTVCNLNPCGSATAVVNTLSTTTGIALNFTSTTIGAGGLTFQSINTTSSAGNAGIVLSTTGSNAGLTVTGTGALGTGGVISGKTVPAVQLTSTKNVSLNWMQLTTNPASAVNGTSVNGFSLANSAVTNNGTSGPADGIIMTDTTGAVSFNTDTVTGNGNSNVFLTTTVGSVAAITTLTVTNGSYSNAAADDGFLVDLRGTASIATATVSGVTFDGNFAKGIQFQQNDNAVIGNGTGAPATGTATVTNSTFTNNNVAASFEGGTGVAGTTGSVYYRFVDNLTITGSVSNAVNFANGSDSGGGTYKAYIKGNVIGNAGTVGSGSASGDGIRVFMQGQQTATVTIVGNTVRQTPLARGIDVQELGRPNAGFGQTALDVVVTGNDVNPQDTLGFPQYAIYIGADAQGTGTSGSVVHAEVHDNTVPAPASGACDTQCGSTIGMIFYETVNNASGTTGGTLRNFDGTGVTVTGEIDATNTGVTGLTTSFENLDHGGAGPGGLLTLTAAAPNQVN